MKKWGDFSVVMVNQLFSEHSEYVNLY